MAWIFAMTAGLDMAYILCIILCRLYILLYIVVIIHNVFDCWLSRYSSYG